MLNVALVMERAHKHLQLRLLGNKKSRIDVREAFENRST
jgi:hypothetical protein